MFFYENLIYIGIWFFTLQIYFLGYNIDKCIPIECEKTIELKYFKSLFKFKDIDNKKIHLISFFIELISIILLLASIVLVFISLFYDKEHCIFMLSTYFSINLILLIIVAVVNRIYMRKY